jgi:cytosine/uracil/thiamine/allantoin permease
MLYSITPLHFNPPLAPLNPRHPTSTHHTTTTSIHLHPTLPGQGPVIGVIIADFWIVRGRTLDVDGLYSTSPQGPYFYSRGYNRAAVVGPGIWGGIWVS